MSKYVSKQIDTAGNPTQSAANRSLRQFARKNAIHDGSLPPAQHEQQTYLDNSPRQLAQAEQLKAMFGPEIQRVADEGELQMKTASPVMQAQEFKEEELLQRKFAPLQRVEEEEEPLQAKFVKPAAMGQTPSILSVQLSMLQRRVHAGSVVQRLVPENLPPGTKVIHNDRRIGTIVGLHYDNTKYNVKFKEGDAPEAVTFDELQLVDETVPVAETRGEDDRVLSQELDEEKKPLMELLDEPSEFVGDETGVIKLRSEGPLSVSPKFEPKKPDPVNPKEPKEVLEIRQFMEAHERENSELTLFRKFGRELESLGEEHANINRINNKLPPATIKRKAAENEKLYLENADKLFGKIKKRVDSFEARQRPAAASPKVERRDEKTPAEKMKERTTNEILEAKNMEKFTPLSEDGFYFGGGDKNLHVHLVSGDAFVKAPHKIYFIKKYKLNLGNLNRAREAVLSRGALVDILLRAINRALIECGFEEYVRAKEDLNPDGSMKPE